MSQEAQQRLRVAFCKGPEMRYISHLDLARVWERLLRRADAPLAYSLGFNPHPRLFFAAALPLGFASRGELLDVLLAERVDTLAFAKRLQAQLLAGLQLLSVTEVPLELPSLPSQVVAAEYEAWVVSQDGPQAMQARLDQFLAAAEIPWRRERPTGGRNYDLRPLVQSLRLVRRSADVYVMAMRLQADQKGTGRPDEVLAALGLTEGVQSIERVKLLLCAWCGFAR
jgi:radical SAM-linked protein